MDCSFKYLLLTVQIRSCACRMCERERDRSHHSTSAILNAACVYLVCVRYMFFTENELRPMSQLIFLLIKKWKLVPQIRIPYKG